MALALQPSAERRLEASQQGTSFLQHIEAAWPTPAPRWNLVAGDRVPVYAVAVGFAAAVHDINLPVTLQATAIAFAGALTSASIRLSVLGQTDAQRIHAGLMDRLIACADKAEQSSLDDLGSATWLSDIASMTHETQTTRLFRS